MSGEHKPGRDWAQWAYSGAGVLTLVGVWALDVFTVHGLLTALFLASTDGMLWPWATRIVWWVIFWQAAIGVEMRTVWREARLEVGSKRQLWLAAHVSLVHRLARRGRHHYGAIPNALAQRQRRHPVDTPAATPEPVFTAPSTAAHPAAEAA